MVDYKSKYQKYKLKYLMLGGSDEEDRLQVGGRHQHASQGLQIHGCGQKW